MMKKKALQRDAVVLEYCRNKKVLDVGCVGQDVDSSNTQWLHQKIKNVATVIHGVDTNIEGVKKLNSQGFTIFTTHEIENNSEKYDVIHMGDVIEHVDNAVSFLEFYTRFLNDDGKILITTPNANRINDTLNILFFGNYYINTEHTCWYCRITFEELSKRANLKIAQFEWLDSYTKPKSDFVTFVVNTIRKFFCFLRSDYYPNMLFILVKK